MAEYNGWSNYETWAYHLWLVDSNVNAYGKYKDIHTTYLLSKVLKEEAEEVFYASKNKGVIKGVEKKKRSKSRNRKKTKR